MSKFRGATQKFWIVVSDEGGMSPYPYLHTTETEAFSEAGRLSRNHESAFYVLEAKGACKRVDVVTKKFDGSNDDIPF
jgi:hypothetical protein